MWVISAITLNGVVVAALLRPIEHTAKKQDYCETAPQEETRMLNGNCDTDDVSEKESCCDVSKMFDFSLLKSPTFLVYGSSCFLCMLGECLLQPPISLRKHAYVIYCNFSRLQ